MVFTYQRLELLKINGSCESDWLPPASPMDALRRRYGVNDLRRAYRENLIIVLEHVTRLCYELLHYKPAGQIVITADHGELLGEKGRYPIH